MFPKNRIKNKAHSLHLMPTFFGQSLIKRGTQTAKEEGGSGGEKENPGSLRYSDLQMCLSVEFRITGGG